MYEPKTFMDFILRAVAPLSRQTPAFARQVPFAKPTPAVPDSACARLLTFSRRLTAVQAAIWVDLLSDVTHLARGCAPWLRAAGFRPAPQNNPLANRATIAG